jgi:sugar-specific transcriptional regulator TrmB
LCIIRIYVLFIKFLFMVANEDREIDKNIYTSLKELDLHESEANLYLISLKLGPASIASLAEHLGISRPNVYKAISGLEKRGLAKFSERKRYARTFVVEPPTTLLELLRKKGDTLSDLDHALVGAMPELLTHYHQGETPTKIKVLQGEEQWLKIFFQVLDETASPISFFGSADSFIEMVSWEIEREWIKKRTQKGIHINVILTPGEDAQKLKEADSKEMRTTRIFNGEITFVTSFMLYANKVIVWQPKAPLVLLVEDEYIVDMLKSIFYYMWNSIKE